MSVDDRIKKRKTFESETVKVALSSGIVLEVIRLGAGPLGDADERAAARLRMAGIEEPNRLSGEFLLAKGYSIGRILVDGYLVGWEWIPGETFPFDPANRALFSEELSPRELQEIGLVYYKENEATDDLKKRLEEYLQVSFPGSRANSSTSSTPQSSPAEPASD